MPDINDEYWAVTSPGSTVKLSKADGDALVRELKKGIVNAWVHGVDIFGSAVILNLAHVENISLKSPKTTRLAIEWSQERATSVESCQKPEWEP